MWVGGFVCGGFVLESCDSSGDNVQRVYSYYSLFFT